MSVRLTLTLTLDKGINSLIYYQQLLKGFIQSGGKKWLLIN